MNFPKVKRTDAFILNTRGGLKLFRLYLPGLSGVAQLLPALILSLKGFRIVGMQILNGKGKYKALLSLPFDIAIIPVAVGYYLMGRFFLAKTLVATHACNNNCTEKSFYKYYIQEQDVSQ